jgi:hypothetical protein
MNTGKVVLVDTATSICMLYAALPPCRMPRGSRAHYLLQSTAAVHLQQWHSQIVVTGSK